jgi:peptidoglycan/LPS O-acetylase OafA/YrhL
MNATPARSREPYLHSLDLLRGLGAVAVCVYHISFMLTPGLQLLSGSYLCVDLFFLLSGFVIARTYDHQIAAGMTFRSFFIQRFARLYPLFIMATLIGFVVINARLYEIAHGYGGGLIYLTLLGNLLLIPNFLEPFGIRSMFPFNGASWSIFFEFAVNIPFFLFWRQLTSWRLVAVIAVNAMLLVFVAFHRHSLDLGSKTPDLLFSAPRVGFAFFLGVAISRSKFGHSTRAFGAWTALLGMGVLSIIVFGHRWLPAAWVPLADIAVVLGVMPALFLLFLRIDLVGIPERIAAFLGDVSYSVYLLQTPLIVAVSAIPRVLAHDEIAHYAPWAGFLFMPTIMTISYFVWKYFEVPAKRAIRRWRPRTSRVLGEAV